MLDCKPCPVNNDSIGERWQVVDEDNLAKLVAVISMGQAKQVSYILETLGEAVPAFTNEDLCAEAKIKLTVEEPAGNPRGGYPRWQRDGYIFEIISWIAAKIAYGNDVLIKSPHVSATSQGLDGLMLELTEDRRKIYRATLLEDKCTNDPKATFDNKVVPAFIARQSNKRSAEIIDAAATLLSGAGLEDHEAAQASADVTDKSIRSFRAAFSLPESFDNQPSRSDLFSTFKKVDCASAPNRVGATFITSIEMRDWFDQFAEKVRDKLDLFLKEKVQNV
ncbi:hypothetical protein [Thalassospira sp.]|uniref:hypothetical protein n=1 Tax=Thalassospira sp. TaxID=1912094 RepID=UPI003AA867E6